MTEINTRSSKKLLKREDEASEVIEGELNSKNKKTTAGKQTPKGKDHKEDKEANIHHKDKERVTSKTRSAAKKNRSKSKSKSSSKSKASAAKATTHEVVEMKKEEII